MPQAKPNKYYEWAIMPDIYIATALLICEQLIISGNIITGNITKRLGLRSGHPSYELIYPLIFNFKHGIELYIKMLGILDYQTYKSEHDLKKLFKEVKGRAKGTINETTVNQLYSNTWGIIKKYYYGRYIPFKKGCNFGDKKNEAERYPEPRYYENDKRKNILNRIYRLLNRYEWVTDKLIKDIQNDIKIIESNFAQAKRDIKPIKTLFKIA